MFSTLPFSSQISWVRRRGEDIHLLSFGRHTYSADSRYSLAFEHPNDWRLLIQYVSERDEGFYECQISTHPPLVRRVHLTVVGKWYQFVIFILYISSCQCYIEYRMNKDPLYFTKPEIKICQTKKSLKYARNLENVHPQSVNRTINDYYFLGNIKI